MKPTFALNLTEEGVTLLHRTARGWLDVGSASFSDPDLPAALDYLRSTALGLSPKGIATKLVIPNSQILYTEVDAPGPDDEARRTQIEKALEGRTPYSVEDLVYDWTIDGTTAKVAVVARETLAEAEGFATEHRFNPVSFVAIPEDNFDGEPFFGPSSMAPGLLSKSQKLERDDQAISIITREMPKDDGPAAEAALSGADLTKGGDPEPSRPEPEAEPESEPVTPPEVTPEPAPKPEPVPSPFPWPEMPTPQPAPPQPAPPQPAPPPAFDPPPQPDWLQKASAAARGETDEAPMAVDVPVDDDRRGGQSGGRIGSASVTSPRVDPMDDLPPAPSAAALMAFASRRAGDAPPPPARSAGSAPPPLRTLDEDGPSAAPPVAAAPGLPPAASGAAQTGAAPAAGSRMAPPKPGAERPAPARSAPKFSYDDPVPPPPRLPGDPPVAPPGLMGKQAKPSRNPTAMVTAPTIAGLRGKKPGLNGAAPGQGGPSAAASAVDAPASGRSQSNPVRPETLSKGLGSRSAPVRGKPRYLGLILTGVLLLILALVAAWSSYYLTQRDQGTDPVAVVEGDVPAPDDEMLADQQDPADFPATDQDSAAITAGAQDSPVVNLDVAQAPVVQAPDGDADLPPEEVTAAPDALVAEVAPDDALPPEPEATVAEAVPAEPAAVAQAAPLPEPAPQTGVDTDAANVAALDPQDQDEIFLAGMDSPPLLSDPLTLSPPASGGDTLPGPQMPPPPFGTVYRFDANGMILPTPEGILTPEGVLLVSGKPPLLPPSRPATIEAEAASVDAAPAVEVPVVADTPLTPAQTYAADPALSDARPRTRPPELVPAAPAAGADDASLAPAEDSRFASLRPRLRPQTILAAGEAARRASESASIAARASAASIAAEAAIIEASASIAADTSPQAVAVSRVPAPRPRNLSRAIEAAVSAATRQPDVRVAAAAAPATPKAKAHDEADDEPEVAAVAPRIPTRANVAKQATFVNAINLSKVNLIGVYGTQSQRYALIRQSNGRYKKVRVGDNLDGGRVQAITANEVRYQKGGRLVTLDMPKG